MANELQRIQRIRESEQPLARTINPLTDVEGSLSSFATSNDLATQNLAQQAQLKRQQLQNRGFGYGIDLDQPLDSVPSAQLQQREGLPPITQTFGQRSQYDVFSGGVNYGVDFGIKEGTPVGLPAGQWQVLDAYNQASGRGYIGNNQNSGYGNSILVRNTQTGETLRLSHLSNVGVRPGQVIPGGTVIARSGQTGNVTGPHLDVEYRDPSGRLGDVLRTPYASSLVGKGGGASLGQGGGIGDVWNNVKSTVGGFVQGIKDTNAEARNREYNQRAIYGDDAYRNAQLSRVPVLPNINWRGVQQGLAERNLPGQVMTGALADRQAKDPRWSGLRNMDQGLPMSDAQKGAITDSSIMMVGGSVQPISARSRLPRNRFIKAQELIEGEDSARSIEGIREIDRLAEKYLSKKQLQEIAKIKYPSLRYERQLQLLDEVLPQPQQVAQQVDPLIQEARKYKSAEEFIGANQKHNIRGFNIDKPLLHGGTVKNGDFSRYKGKVSGGIFFSDDIGLASAYAGTNGSVTKAYLDIRNPRVYATESEMFKELNKGVDLASQGYDGIIVKDKGFYSVFDPSQIKTKQQLTDIYNKAKGLIKK